MAEGALVPVRCVPEHGYAVYVEPNVWVRHACDRRAAAPAPVHRNRRPPS
jgi:hypothetical protein